jgi:hypothetical protein
LGTLEGRVVQIPIGGTLENPKLDPRALQFLTAGTTDARTSIALAFQELASNAQRVGQRLSQDLLGARAQPAIQRPSQPGRDNHRNHEFDTGAETDPDTLLQGSVVGLRYR